MRKGPLTKVSYWVVATRITGNGVRITEPVSKTLFSKYQLLKAYRRIKRLVPNTDVKKVKMIAFH